MKVVIMVFCLCTGPPLVPMLTHLMRNMSSLILEGLHSTGKSHEIFCLTCERTYSKFRPWHLACTADPCPCETSKDMISSDFSSYESTSLLLVACKKHIFPPPSAAQFCFPPGGKMFLGVLTDFSSKDLKSWSSSRRTVRKQSLRLVRKTKKAEAEYCCLQQGKKFLCPGVEDRIN